MAPLVHRSLLCAAQVLELRPYMYKDRHYKRTAGGKSEIPEFFGVGTVVDDARVSV